MKTLTNLIVISDIHAGCKLALCPDKVVLDEGGTYRPSAVQRKVKQWWDTFWKEWVQKVTKGEPFAVAVNGDSIDGSHHGSTSQISHNPADQKKIAYELLAPVRDACGGRLYMIRGTEAHTGVAGEAEESLAQMLDAVPDSNGNYSRFELWIEIGKGLVHCAHHIGTTGSMAYETTALMKEYAESCADAARWEKRAPNVIIRSHRHRSAKITVPTKEGEGTCMTTPGWQLKTPFVFKIPGGRITQPQVGGAIVRYGDEELFVRSKIWDIERPKPVKIKV